MTLPPPRAGRPTWFASPGFHDFSARIPPPLVGGEESPSLSFNKSVIVVMVSESNVNGRENRYAEYAYLRGARRSLS